MAFQGDSIFWVEVEKIVPNPFQPRRDFDQEKLKELAESVRMYGILQPLTVTRKEVSRDDGAFYSEYELIAGERRLRASRLAGLAQVPVIIREGEQNEQEKLEIAIIENLQREDLNAVDRAIAFRQLADTFGLSHAQVAKKVGRSREYVSNTLRILNLRDYMLDSLKVGDISEGHARTLLMLNDRPEEQDTVYREILLKKLSVREVERITRKIATDKVRKKIWQNTDSKLIEIEKQFTESLGTRVQIAKTDYGGKISIDYFSDDDLTTLLERLRDESRLQKAKEIIQATKETVNTEETMETENNEVAVGQEMMSQITAVTPLETIVEKVITDDNTDLISEPEVATELTTEITTEIENTLTEEIVTGPSDTVDTVDTVKTDESFNPELTNNNASTVESVSELVEQVFATEDNNQIESPAPVVSETIDSSNNNSDLDTPPVAHVADTPEEVLQEMASALGQPEPEDESDLYSIKNFGV